MTVDPIHHPDPETPPAAPRVIREVEHKFRVHSLFTLPDLVGLDSVGGVDDVASEDVDSSYLDTADLRLVRDGITLRRRSGGEDEGWHLKLPVVGADSSVHDELRVPLTATGEPPTALTGLVSAIVRSAPLVDVARLRGRRDRMMIRDTDNIGVALLVDDSMEVVDRSGTVTARFRELELDPIAAAATTEEVVAEVASALNEAGGLGGDFVAKVVRALGPRATSPPEVPVIDVPDDPAKATVAEVFVASASRTIRTLRAADLDFRRNPDDPKAVHKARVATRRLRTALRTYRSWTDNDRVDPLVASLKQVGDVLGRLRELDVVTENLLGSLDDAPDRGDSARDHVASVLGSRRRDARDAVLTVLESRRYLDLHESLVTTVQMPPTTPEAGAAIAAEALPSSMEKPWSKLAAAVADRGGTTSDGDWHRIRLAAKRVRYAAEALAPGIGPEATRFAEAVADVTDLLGDQHDAVVAAHVAMSVGTTSPVGGDIGFALGRVAARQREQADRLAARFPDVWAAASRPKLRRWFAG